MQQQNGEREVPLGWAATGPARPVRRSRWLAVGLASVVTFVLIAPRAQAALCSKSFAMRISPAGFDLIADVLLDPVQGSFAIPAFSTVVVDWPLTSDDARLEMSSTPGAITLHEIHASYVGDGMRLSGRADVNLRGQALVTNAYVGFGRDTCQVNVQLPNLVFDLDLKLHSHAGALAVEVTHANVTSDQSRRVVDIGGCTVGEIYNSLANTLGTQTEVGTRQWLEAFARDKLPRAIESSLNQSAQASQASYGIDFSARVDSATTDHSGMVLRVNTGVASTTNGVASCVHGVTAAVAPACGEETPLPSSNAGAMLSAAASEGLVDDALYAVWRAGHLCINSETLKYAAISENLSKLAAIFGLPAGARLSFQVSPQAPPHVRFSIQHGAQLTIERLGVQLTINSNGEGPSGQMGANMDVTVALTPWTDPATNSLSFDMGQMSLLRLEIQHAGGSAASLQLDPARMQRFVSDVVLPLIRKQLNAVPLSPSLAVTSKYLVELQHAFVGDGYLEVHVNAFDRDRAAGDTTPPDTALLGQTGPLVGPQVLVLRVQGADDRTPPGLLRFVVRIDGGAWSEPQFGGRVEVATHNGQHAIEVAAMDLAGNIDPTPIATTVLVDDSPPQLQITERPESLINQSSATVGFTGEDDSTPVSSLVFTADLFRVTDNGGAVELVKSESPSPGTRRASFSGLENGTYRIRVAVRDSVGNVTSEDVGVVVAGGGGCDLAGDSRQIASSAALLLLLFGSWACTRRRARRRKAV